jgi:hypothetical protein
LSQPFKNDHAPCLVIATCESDELLDDDLPFSGILSGHDFSFFIQAFYLVSKRDSGLKPDNRKESQF